MSKVLRLTIASTMAFLLFTVVYVSAWQSAAPEAFAASPASTPALAPGDVVTFTILHTNDFHGHLQTDPGRDREGSAYVAGKVDETVH